MATIPTAEPPFFHAGDTLKWQRSFPDYPASAGWTLSYRLVNSTGNISITATPSGDDHLVDLSSSTTATYPAGIYTWHAVVTKAGERHTVGTGTITIKPNIADQVGGFDARSNAKKALDDLRAALATFLATKGHVQEYQIAGRVMRYRSAADIQRAISLLEREVAREEAEERLAAGLGIGRRVLVRF